MKGKLGVFAILYCMRNPEWITLVQHNYGQRKWSLPGGGLEEKELINEGIIREIREETGYCNYEIIRVVGFFSSRKGNFPTILFECNLMNYEKKSFDEKEILEVNTFHLNHLPDNMYPAQKRMINYWQEKSFFDSDIFPIYDWLS